MKPIKSIQQLKAEKKRIQLHQQSIENKICTNWGELKEDLTLFNFTKNSNDKSSNNADKSSKKESILKSTFVYGASLLAKKLADKTTEKIGTFLKNK
jgi:hypothetical protein